MRRKLQVKVCGMRDAENILDIARLSPDYMGFIFYPESPRYVGPDFMIPPEFPPHIIRTGVFVDASTSALMEMAMKHDLDFVQLHGNEPPGQCIILRRLGLRVIKALPVGTENDVRGAESYAGAVDYLLYDTRGAAHGGNGQPFDWGFLQSAPPVPFMVSGGISPANVLEAIQSAGPLLQGVDINSRVEVGPGFKSIAMVADVIQKIKTTQLQ